MVKFVARLLRSRRQKRNGPLEAEPISAKFTIGGQLMFAPERALAQTPRLSDRFYPLVIAITKGFLRISTSFKKKGS